MPPDLPPDTRRRLVGVLGMLGSSHEGERAAAALLATRMVRDCGLGWEEIVAKPRLERPEPPPDWRRPEPPPDPGWRDLVHRCRAHPSWLSGWEEAFLASVVRRRGLSLKQHRVLDGIALRLRSMGLVV